MSKTQEHNEPHVDFTRQCGKSPVTTSAVLHCVYLAWKHPRRRIEVAFQVSRPAFPPRTRPCERSKRLRSTMNRTLTSPDSVVSPQSQRAQFSIAFILPGNTHAAGSRCHFRGLDRLFHHEDGLACGQRDIKDISNRTVTSPESWSSPQLQQAHFSIGFYITWKHPCSLRRLNRSSEILKYNA